ncbi:MAG TPA: hypothetical protein VIZ18_03380 [Ktedonobacteraceae bacterium]
MPTQEERLSALEKFQSLTATHIREVDENITILLGVVQKQGRDIRRTFQRLEIMDETLEAVEDRLKGVDERLGSVESHLGAVEGHLGSVEDHLGVMDGHLELVEGRLLTVENRFGHLENGFASQENKLDQVLLLLNLLTTKPNQETE